MIELRDSYIEQALDEIDALGIDGRLRSTKHCLVARERHYPPKHVVRLAFRKQYGADPKYLSGGKMSNEALTSNNYEILTHCRCGNTCKFAK